MTLSERAGLFFPFISGLNDNSKSQLDNQSSILTAKRGTQLFSQGNITQGAYLILSGQLDAYVISESGQEKTLYRLNGGQTCLCNINTAFSRVSFPLWVRVASTEATVIHIPSNLLRELHEFERSIRDWLYQVQSGQVLYLLSSMAKSLTLPIEQRLRNYLIATANPDCVIMETHESIAAYLGTVREVVTRHLNNLAEQELIKLSRGRISILNMKGIAINQAS